MTTASPRPIDPSDRGCSLRPGRGHRDARGCGCACHSRCLDLGAPHAAEPGADRRQPAAALSLAKGAELALACRCIDARLMLMPGEVVAEFGVKHLSSSVGGDSTPPIVDRR